MWAAGGEQGEERQAGPGEHRAGRLDRGGTRSLLEAQGKEGRTLCTHFLSTVSSRIVGTGLWTTCLGRKEGRREAGSQASVIWCYRGRLGTVAQSGGAGDLASALVEDVVLHRSSPPHRAAPGVCRWSGQTCGGVYAGCLGGSGAVSVKPGAGGWGLDCCWLQGDYTLFLLASLRSKSGGTYLLNKEVSPQS